MEKNGKKHILVVDDEEANVFMLEGILLNEGFRVTTASDGYECLEKLRSVTDIDLVLLDIMMPGMSGIDLLERLESHGQFKNIPVIMVSALTDGDNIQEALSLGAVEYIKKPIDEVEMLARIKTAIKLKDQEEKLKGSIRIKDDFIRMMSNELVSSFTKISDMAGLLMDDKKLVKDLNKEQQAALGQVTEISCMAIDYFNKMLTWSNLGQRQLMLEKEKTGLKEILIGIETMFKAKIASKKIKFTINVYDLQMQVDKLYFNHAIMNLVSNALRFVPVNGEVKIFDSSVDDVRVLNISDNGPGITYDKKFLLTSQYIRATPDTDGVTGSGTGIYISRSILEAHGFSLDYTTEPGKGTTMMVFLKNYNL